MSEPSTSDRTQVQSGSPTVSRESVQGFPTIPGYEIVREIGRGGMGVVYQAKQQALGRLVAIKLMQKDDGLHQARFLAEGQIIAAVKHPHVVEIYDFGETNSLPYIAMELLPGGSLGQRFREGALSAKEAAGLIAQVADGVGAAHDLGIVHRDLKPGNVLLDAHGVPKVTDFGLAKRTDFDLTLTHEAAGTPSYMAPEQARAMKFVGPPADVWSLGVMLYEALTGRRPFQAATDVELLISIQNDDPPTLRTITKSIPPDLETICLKCLEKEPERRYASAKELAADVRAWLSGRPIAARRATPIEKAMLWIRRKPTAAAAWAMGVLVVILGTFAFTTTRLWRAAVAERAIAEDKSQQAEAAERTVARLEYARAVYAAHQDALAANFLRADQVLEGTKPEFRGWEWHYVKRLCHRERRSLPEAQFATFDPTGTGILTSDYSEFTYYEVTTGEKKRTFEPTLTRKEREAGKYNRNTNLSARFSADGGTLATVGCIRDLTVWNARDGKEIVSFMLPDGYSEFLQLSPDGSRIATLQKDRAAVIWDSKTGRKLFEAPPSEWPPAVAPDCQRVAVKRNNPERVEIATPTAVKPLASLPKFTWGGLVFSPDGLHIAHHDNSGNITLWDAESGKILHRIEAYAGLYQPTENDGTGYRPRNLFQSFEPLVFDPSGKSFVTLGPGHLARVWDVETGRTKSTLIGHTGRIDAATFSPQGTFVVTASADRTVMVWDPATGRPLRTYAGHTGEVRAVAVNPRDTRLLLTVANDGAKLWDADLGTRTFAQKWPHKYITSFAIRPDGRRFAVPKNGFTVFDLDGGEKVVSRTRNEVRDKPFEGWLGARPEGELVTYSPDGTRIAASSRRGSMSSTQTYPNGEVKKFEFSDREARVYDAQTGDEILVLKGHTEQVNTIQFSPDGTRLVTASDDKTARIWDAVTGKQIHVLTWDAQTLVDNRVIHPANEMRAAAFTPDGRTVLTLSFPTLKQWDIETGREVPVFGGTGNRPTVGGDLLTVHPDGTRVATTNGNDVTLWDLRTGAVTATLKGHEATPCTISFNADGSRVVTAGGYDSTVRIWDTASGALMVTLTGHTGAVRAAAFTPDETRIVSAGDDGVIVWDSRPVNR